MISRFYELVQTKTFIIPEMDIHATVKKQPVETEEMFHGVTEIKKRLNKGFKISDTYGKYPELLQTLTLKDLIFTDIDVEFEDSDHSMYIPPVDPPLFNNFLFAPRTKQRSLKTI